MELKDKVILTEDDVKMVEEFFQHYNDPKTHNLVMTDRLRNEIDKFRDKNRSKSYTTEDQKMFSVALAGAISKTTHPLLKDVALKDVLGACTDVWTDEQFYEELEKNLTHPQTEEEG